MKSRNITSLFMGESKYGNSVAIFRALLLVTIFAVGILSSMGSAPTCFAPTPPPPSGCFTPDTKIVMADGSLKDISDVAVGDILKSYNEETGSLVTTEVVKTYEFNQNHYYLINKGIKITDKHRFLTDSGWKRACDLKVGDKIQSQGKFIEIGSIELTAPLDIKVYNLGVDNHHSFLVSDGVNPYVVHNCGDGDGDDDVKK